MRMWKRLSDGDGDGGPYARLCECADDRCTRELDRSAREPIEKESGHTERVVGQIMVHVVRRSVGKPRMARMGWIHGMKLGDLARHYSWEQLPG